MSDRDSVSRRDLLALAAAFLPSSLTQGAEQGDSGIGRLPRPGMAGMSRERITDYENDPLIIGIEERLRCTCGCNLDVYTCRTTDFTCQTSPAMHREVVGLVEQGLSSQQVLDEFVARHGELVLMAPRKEGFNILGYVLPGTAISAVGIAMLWILARRTRHGNAIVADGARETDGLNMSSGDAERLKAELADLDN